MKLLRRTGKVILLTAIAILVIAVFFLVSNKSELVFAEGENYLTFTAQESNSSITVNYKSGTNIKYKKNTDNDWIDCPSGTLITLTSVGDYVFLKGDGFSTYADASNIASFGMSGLIAGSGDITSLLNGVGGNVALESNCFRSMFKGCTSLTSSPNLPSESIASSCYQDMFFNCSGLLTAPALPATTLAASCYRAMFCCCSSLITAPALPATSLYNCSNCYFDMFNSCSSLITAPTLPATTLSGNCYRGMFGGCTSLTTAPSLPSENIASSCYQDMFFGCSALVNAPTLPATTLAGSCYRAMFCGCTSLVTPPALPATSLNNCSNCYYEMFNGCTSLASTPTLPATTLAASCYRGMFYACTSLTTATDFPATYLPNSCYRDMFMNCSNLNSEINIAATEVEKAGCQGMFYNCKALTSAPDLLSESLAQDCYSGMFSGCSALVNPPTISATTVAESCCSGMFSGCTNLVSAPTLLAQDLAVNCYKQMFNGCTALTIVPDITANTAANYSCHGMFKNCTALVTPPQISITTLADYCYYEMFSGCSSLTTAPTLSATTMDDYCYCSMFSDCGFLETAPSLPSTTLAVGCYRGMFINCSNLTTSPVLAAETLYAECYYSMFQGCIGLETASAISATTVDTDSCRDMFNGCTNLTAAPVFTPSSIGTAGCYGMFSGCTSLSGTPNLTATTLNTNGYREMFKNCIALTTVSTLPALSVPQSCYQDMFTNCSSLVTPPELPATTLGKECYRGMFYNCSSLTTSPNLSAESLDIGCYRGMFLNCKKLSTAPNLTALSLAKDCYSEMFKSCSSLIAAPTISATSLAESCCSYMFKDCVSLVTAPTLLATELAAYCYREMFSGCSKLIIAAENGENSFFACPSSTANSPTENMFLNTAGTFSGTPSANVNYYYNTPKATITTTPTAKTLTYDGTTRDLITEGAAENGKLYFAIGTDSITAPSDSWDTTLPQGKNASTYYVWYKLVANPYYAGKEPVCLTTIIGKVEITIDWIEDNFTYNGNTQVITASYNNIDSEEISLKVTLDEVFKNAGTYTATASFDNGEINYSLPTTCTKEYTIKKAQSIIDTANVLLEYTYSGSEQVIDSGATLNHTETQLVYENNTFTDVGTGSYVLTIKAAESSNYNSASVGVTITVNKAVSVITLDQTPLSVFFGEDIILPQATTNYGTVVCDTLITDLVNAGEYILTYKVADTSNYTGDTKTLSVTIKKLPTSISLLPSPKILTYAKSPQELITAGIATNGTMNYALGTSSTVAPTENWSDRIPLGDVVGSYCVWYKVVGGLNFYDTEAGCVVSEINPKELSIEWTHTIFTYDGQPHKPTATATIISGDICEIMVGGERINAGNDYVAAAESLSNDNYILPIDDEDRMVTFTIDKAIALIDSTDIITTYTYTGNVITIDSGAVLNHEETAIEYIDNKLTDAGTYPLTLRAAATANYYFAVKMVEITVNKATAHITVDQTPIEVTFGDVIELPTATTTFGEVACDSLASELVNAGEYIVNYIVPTTKNIIGDTKTVNVVINKMKVDEPSTTGEYKYTGKAQKVSLTGVESYMITTDSLLQTNVGIYTITFTLDNNHEWKDGVDGKITWEIKATALSGKTDSSNKRKKDDVIIDTDIGFDSDICVSVDLSQGAQVSQKNFAVDYYNIKDEMIKLGEDEKVSFVFDIKLVREVNGKLMEIQPDEIEEGATINVKILLPTDVDTSTITRILHVHSSTDIEEIIFDSSEIDANGYYEITLDRLSEFAFICKYEPDNSFKTIIIVCSVSAFVVIVVTIVLLCVIWKRKKINLDDILGI